MKIKSLAMEAIREKRVIDMTASEFADVLCEVMKRVLSKSEDVSNNQTKRLEYGIAGIARIFNCSMTTANRIKSSGKIDEAILQSGRMIAVDVDLALKLFKEKQ